jgi:VanZ family protein
MINRLLAVASWLVLAYVAFATLSPIALRPELTNANVERFGAFMLVGLLFALAYPQRFYLVVGTTVGSAILLEALQFLSPGRHGRIHDAGVKIAGGIAGIFIGKIVMQLTTPRRIRCESRVR